MRSVRRKPGELLDLEAQILRRAVDAASCGSDELHGFGIAKQLADRAGSQRLTAHGTLYKALARLERAGLLESRWEDAHLAAAEGRPRRRLYRVTSAGRVALSAHQDHQAPGTSVATPTKGIAPA